MHIKVTYLWIETMSNITTIIIDQGHDYKTGDHSVLNACNNLLEKQFPETTSFVADLVTLWQLVGTPSSKPMVRPARLHVCWSNHSVSHFLSSQSLQCGSGQNENPSRNVEKYRNALLCRRPRLNTSATEGMKADCGFQKVAADNLFLETSLCYFWRRQLHAEVLNKLGFQNEPKLFKIPSNYIHGC